MTIKSLQKIMGDDQQQEIQNPKLEELKRRLAGKPFWTIYPKHRNYDDNFNSIIGLPKKPGSDKEYPIFDYEIMIFRALEEPAYLNAREPTKEEREQYEKRLTDAEAISKKKQGNIKSTQDWIRREKTEALIYPERVNHCLILKSAGLGLTTFFLRYIAWLCLKDDLLKGKDIVIISGPRERLSIDLLTRLRQLFLPFNVTFDTRENTMFLNGVRIRSMPSNNLAAARGIESLALAFLDESAFFGHDSQSEILDLVERYAGKSRAKIILCSTPNRPGDLMHTILNSSKKDFYKVLKFDYSWGLNKIYTEEDIRIAKASDSFEREYNLSFSSPEGNVFSHASINRAIELASKYPDTINKAAQHSVGVDPGFGSSQFGICILEYSDGTIKVVFAEQYERSSFNDMVQKIWELKTIVGELSNVYIDHANVEYIEAVKQELGDDTNWQRIHDTLKRYRDMNLRIEDSNMKVIPVSFREEGASMLTHCKNLLENEDPFIAINRKHEELITSLRGAKAQEYKLNKTETPFPDLMDAFRLAMKFFHLEK